MKKHHQKALVSSSQEEYVSGGEDEDGDESEEVGMAALAIGRLPSNLAPLFSSPNDNTKSKPMCLMAKTSKVNPPSSSTISSIPSLLDCVEDVGDDEGENKVTNFMKKMKGETKEMVESLMLQLGEAKALLEDKEDTIIELEGHARDRADRIAELEDNLVEEK